MAGTVDSGKAKLTETKAVVGAAKAQADEIAGQLGSLGAEGRSAAVAEIAHQVEEVHTALNGLGDKLDEIRTAIEAAKSGLQNEGSTGPTPPAAPRHIDGFTHKRPVREAVDAIKKEGWPKNSNGNVSARGHLYDNTGNRISDTIRPHRKGQAPPCDDLKEPWRSDPEYTTTWHAERDAAKTMRDRNLAEAVLYLNIPLCGRYSEDTRRCDANLEKLIPAGSTLWIWTVSDTGTLAQRRFRGTGDAIQ